MVRKKSGDKYKKALEWHLLVQKKALDPMMKKRADKTIKKVEARLKLYGITKKMVDEYMNKRNPSVAHEQVKKPTKKTPTKKKQVD